MLFNSYEFIFLFFPITLIGYFLLNNYCNDYFAKGWLVLASLYFYSYFNYSYLMLILISIVFNYSLITLSHLSKSNNFKRKIILITGILFNLGTLGYFKYYDFFISNINSLFLTKFPLLNILLPLGISFFTFQQLSFIIDSYNGKNLNYDFLSYCLFVTFFPQLIAGPIVLPNEMLPQFEDHSNKKVNYENLNKGFYLFIIGLGKKIILANSVGAFADAGYSKIDSLTFAEGWITSLSYTMQLYFDFSGYCDMAMGIALMFNIILPLNFNSPYRSLNIQDFWKRWHITLGRFMTNYLYIPLGGNRKGDLKTLRNLLIVFLCSGIWHGAGWTFILWGGLHGISILVHRIWKNFGGKMNKVIAWFLTFNLVNLFWIFFRAKDLNSAAKILKSMFIINDFNSISEISFDPNLGKSNTIILLIISLLIAFFVKNNSFQRTEEMKTNIKTTMETVLYTLISLSLMSGVTAKFLYFNF